VGEPGALNDIKKAHDFFILASAVQPRLMEDIRFGPISLTASNLAGDVSIISIVWIPKARTIFFASVGPMPTNIEDARNFLISEIV